MGYLKLTNVDPAYKGGNDIVINLDNINYFEAVDTSGVRIYSTTSIYQITGPAGGEVQNSGLIGVTGADAAAVLNMVKEINEAITAAPGGPVVTLHTAIQATSFFFGA